MTARDEEEMEGEARSLALSLLPYRGTFIMLKVIQGRRIGMLCRDGTSLSTHELLPPKMCELKAI